MDKCSFLPSQMQLQKSWISSNIKTTCVQKIRKKGQQGNNTYQGQKHSCIISCKFTTYLITLFNKGLGNEKWRVSVHFIVLIGCLTTCTMIMTSQWQVKSPVWFGAVYSVWSRGSWRGTRSLVRNDGARPGGSFS